MPATTSDAKEAKKTTTPRKRTPAAKATTAPAKAKETPKAIKSEAVEAVAVEEGTAKVEKLIVELVFDDTTRRYEKFKAPEDSGCVGTLYVPLGAKTVKVLIEM